MNINGFFFLAKLTYLEYRRHDVLVYLSSPNDSLSHTGTLHCDAPEHKGSFHRWTGMSRRRNTFHPVSWLLGWRGESRVLCNSRECHCNENRNREGEGEREKNDNVSNLLCSQLCCFCCCFTYVYRIPWSNQFVQDNLFHSRIFVSPYHRWHATKWARTTYYCTEHRYIYLWLQLKKWKLVVVKKGLSGVIKKNFE